VAHPSRSGEAASIEDGAEGENKNAPGSGGAGGFQGDVKPVRPPEAVGPVFDGGYAFVEACDVAARRFRAESQRVMSMSFGQASLQLKMV
jgi:hypothetical protein